MTIDQLLRDLDDVVDLVRRRFGKEKVVLLGHSWRTALGTMYAYRRPEKVSAYVGVGQMSDKQAAARYQCRFALGEAHRRGNDGGTFCSRASSDSVYSR